MCGDHYGILTGGGESGQTWARRNPDFPKNGSDSALAHFAALMSHLDVKILSLLVVLVALEPSALAGHGTLLGEAGR